MRTLAIVPARGGSRGIAGKNLRLLGGRPLVAWTAASAAEARSVARTILTTDSDDIAAAGRAAGLEVPFLRPPDLARDDTPMLPVIQHAVAWIEQQGERFDAVCLLQPTVPFRAPGEIDDCIALMEQQGADSAFTVRAVPVTYHPAWVYLEDAAGRLALASGEAEPVTRRQDLPPAWHRDGSVYVVRRDTLMLGNTLYGARRAGLVRDDPRHVNLDTPEDWARAESLVR